MPTPVSEPMRLRNVNPLHRPTLALARWTVLLMGRVWLARQALTPIHAPPREDAS